MISVEKPGSPSEILEHHGTKGMKWGVRRSREFGAQHPTGRSRKDAIRRARASSHLQREKFKTERNPQKRQQMKKVYLKNPDRATALRITRGEKVVLGILAVGLPVAGTAGVAATVGTQVAIRRHIEKKQARGGYG